MRIAPKLPNKQLGLACEFFVCNTSQLEVNKSSNSESTCLLLKLFIISLESLPLPGLLKRVETMATTETSQHTSLSYPINALQISQKAPVKLSQPPPSTSSFPLSLLSKPESREAWAEYEQLFLACLRTGDDKSAHLCLERLTDRFGATDEKVMGLRGLYQEAIAEKESQLEAILKEYHKILDENPVNVVCHTPHCSKQVPS